MIFPEHFLEMCYLYSINARFINVLSSIYENVIFMKTLFFYLQIYYLKRLSLTPCITKETCAKISFNLFLFQLYKRFLISFQRCSMKGGALRKEPHTPSNYLYRQSFIIESRTAKKEQILLSTTQKSSDLSNVIVIFRNFSKI